MLQWMALCSFIVPSSAQQVDLDVPFLGTWEAPAMALAPAFAPPAARAATLSRAFVASHVHPNVELEDLDFTRTPQGDVMHQVQIIDAVPVDGTSGIVQLSGDTIRYAHYRVVTPQRGLLGPRYTGDEARAFVQNIFPEGQLGGASLHWSRADGDLRLVWRVPIMVAVPAGDWAVDVDARDGRYVTRTSLDVNAVEGEVLAPVERRCQGDKPEPTVLRYIQWDEGNYADKAGIFKSHRNVSHATVALKSPYIQLNDLRGQLSGPWTLPLASAPAYNTLALENAKQSHVDAYHSLHHVRDWLADRAQLTERQRAWADRKVVVNLNVSGSCNAFYSTYQESLNFYPAGHGCMDSSRSSQAVFHEYGHALMFHSTPGDLDVTQALGEGYGDVVATFASGNGVMGDIKPDCNTVLRTCVNSMTFCKKGCDFKGWRHAYKSAQVVCAAWWDLRGRMMQRYGDADGARVAADLFVRHLPLVNGDMPDTYAAVIAADDDNNDNPKDGTAHSCEINAAYADRFPDLKPTLVPCRKAH